MGCQRDRLPSRQLEDLFTDDGSECRPPWDPAIPHAAAPDSPARPHLCQRDDFTLFDSYTYTPPPAHLEGGKFPVPMQAYYLEKDKRCKEKHLKMWKEFTTEQLSFVCEQKEGNHLFFYDVPARCVPPTQPPRRPRH